MNLPSGLVPRMRQELEELAKIPGVYQIVDVQLCIHKEDKESNEYKKGLKLIPEHRAHTHYGCVQMLKLGDKITVTSPTGSSWIMNIAGHIYEFSLNQETITQPGGPTFFKDGFVEDGVLKCEVEKNGGKTWFFDANIGKKFVLNKSLETVRLDTRGCLSFTNILQSHNVTLVTTVRTKRICSKETVNLSIFQVFMNTLISVRNAIFTTGTFE